MPELFFNKFPQIEYANSTCVDLTKRVVIDENIRRSPIAYDEYQLKNSSRTDIISDNYYQDPAMDWVIWLTNGIIDPYYGWNLTAEDFDKFIEKKYGSLETAQKKIAYYRNNWRNDESELTPSFYNNTLPKNLKKYYSPIYDNITIIGYARKQDDTSVNTNKIYSFDVTISNGKLFEVGEVVDIKSISPAEIVGGGEVIFANTSVVKIKNISGNTSATNIIYGETSTANATINTSTLIAENIPDDEAIYWSPVSLYDIEYEMNEDKRNIMLMNPTYASEMAYQFRTILKK